MCVDADPPRINPVAENTALDRRLRHPSTFGDTLRTMILSRVLLLTAFALPVLAAPHRSVSDAQAFIDSAEAELLKIGTMYQRAGWVHENFITDDTELLSANQHERVIARITELIGQSKEFEGLNLPPELRRKFLLLKLSLPMPAPKDARLREELTQVASALNGMYGKGKYCPGPNQPCLGIDELQRRLIRSRDANQTLVDSAGTLSGRCPSR